MTDALHTDLADEKDMLGFALHLLLKERHAVDVTPKGVRALAAEIVRLHAELGRLRAEAGAQAETASKGGMG